MPFHDSRLIASALLAGWIAMPGAALAQTQAPATPPAIEDQTEQQPQDQTEGQAEAPTEAAKPTEAQLASFAAATISIVKIQEAAQAQMKAAVEDSGLTIEEYNGIAQAAQSDPEIDKALRQLIQDRLGG